MFIGGTFSSRPEDPFRVDAEALVALTAEELAAGFQVGPENPLVGLEGRAALLNRLGRAVAEDPETFGRKDDPRPGGLFDVLAEGARGGKIPATAILEALLAHLGPIWPGRIALGGVDLGDTWRHPLIAAPDATQGLVPFHKLSQWLSYSLIEPLEWAGFEVVAMDGLTGLPEYRNGGLFLDAGVLALKDPAEAKLTQAVDSTLVVEWRALTVALLDRIADPIRSQLGFTAAAFPLAKVLEGGTWATGPAAGEGAAERRCPAAFGRQRRDGVLMNDAADGESRGRSMQGVTVVDHPLVQHKLTLMRDKERSTKGFRQLLNEIGMLLCYEVTRDLPLEYHRDRDAADDDAGAADRRQEARPRADPARRRRLPRRHADPRALRPRRPYRPLPGSGVAAGGRVLFQGALRSRRPHGPRPRSDAGDGQLGRGGDRPAEGARRQGPALRLPPRRARGHREVPRHCIRTCRSGPPPSTRASTITAISCPASAMPATECTERADPPGYLGVQQSD